MEAVRKAEAGPGQSRVVYLSHWAAHGTRPVTGLHSNRFPPGKTQPVCHLPTWNSEACLLPRGQAKFRNVNVRGRGLFSALRARQVASN